MKYIGAPQSGSQANTTASRNKGGQYYRNRATPTQPRSTAQTEHRANFGSLATAWQMLTQLQRDAWNAYAAVHPRTDSLGQVISLSGLQTFIAFNTLLVTVGDAVQFLPPANDDTPISDAPVLTASSNGALDIAFSGVVPAAGRFAVFLSPPVSAGVSFMRDFRFMEVAVATGGAAATDLVASYEERFGSLLALSGRKVFFKAVPFNDGGVQGASFTGSAVFAA